MNFRSLRSLALIGAFSATLPVAMAQSTDPGAKQDMKNAPILLGKSSCSQVLHHRFLVDKLCISIDC